ncbi:YNFM family putative membrane transporter [Sphingomonas vulcanisoli]|uniref:YNFM family putative membrane transporter n=1 Tax=Sphingomonas vulcanisoli TaxID=1658060 RepID=A0ABX0TLW1_9SPHN|nr:MFS transporter [Sphingomonas vulcanisoli]NIJ06504.1 YNFM family putative membrane transporter [Sphingomonas vulcanisoli]
MTAESSEGHARGSPVYRRLTIAMLFAGFSTFALLYSVQPLLPLFAAEYRLSAAAASLAVSLTTGPLAFAILAAGLISDRIGRRPIMVAAMLAASALTFLAALAPGWIALLALRLLTGLALAGVPAVAMAYVAEEVHGESVGAAMGLYIAGSALGGMGGRLIASVVADLGGWRMALGVVGVVGLAMAEAFRRLAPPSRRFVRQAHSRSGGGGPLVRDPALLLLYAQGFLLMGIFVTLYNYAGFRLLAPPYALSQSEVGAIFLLYVLGSVSSAWFGTLAGRIGRRRIFWLPVVILIGGAGLTAAHPLALIVLGIALTTIGFFGAHSIASAWVGRRAQGRRGQAAAFYLFAYYMGSSLLGSLGGIAWTRDGWTGVSLFCISLGLIALIGAGLLALIPPLPIPDPNETVPVEA